VHRGEKREIRKKEMQEEKGGGAGKNRIEMYDDDESTLPHLPFGCFWLRLKKEKNKISNRMKKSLMSLVVIY
jgi:hypothetical protein